ncbi:TPA: hypothetical protein JL428_004765 [Escherichia coli]|nr:hypothetical protein [Escherichia coli]MDN1445407.1 hypothetical protein [Escherichia coli]MDN1470039.1 hypothetical protein [Escherichia coli]HAW6108451.1 hypothetical protein [Escherichia coli]
MKIYWTRKSIPELSALPPSLRKKNFTDAYNAASSHIAYSALFDHGLASKSDQRFASIRSTGNLTFSTAF